MFLANGLKPRFVFPSGKQFVFDKTANSIVHAIAKRNWNVPGLKIEYELRGMGEDKRICVSKISGEDFRMFFYTWRNHGERETRFDDAVCEICIPKLSIKVFGNEEGPFVYHYVGDDWEADKEWFMDGEKRHAKLRGEPRRYLVYAGKHLPGRENRRPETIEAFDDDGREYSSGVGDPRKYDTCGRLLFFDSWLKSQVLKYIESFPESAEQGDPKIEFEAPIPYNGPWDTLYTFGRLSTVEKVEQAKNDLSQICPSERFAFAGGIRLVYASFDDCDTPREYYEGYIWSYPKKEVPDEIRTHMNYSTVIFDHLFAIKPHFANGVYVVDNAAYEKAKESLMKGKKFMDFRSVEAGLARLARAKTLVPITEYKGDYKEPIVLFGREIGFDEVEYIGEVK